MKTQTWISDSERREIVQLLRAGHSALEIHRRTGRSPYAIRRIRDAHELTPVGTGRTAKPDPVRGDDGEDFDGPSRADPWIPPPGFDPFEERPHQARWLDLLERVPPESIPPLRRAVCHVLGLSAHASEEGIVKALIAEKRSADELARLYLDAALGVVS